MWFSSAAAKRLNGRYFDLHSHLQAALQRDRERAAVRAAAEEAKHFAALNAEMASSRVQERKERDRQLSQRKAAQSAEDRAARRSRRRTAQPCAVEQWRVDPQSIAQPIPTHLPLGTPPTPPLSPPRRLSIASASAASPPPSLPPVLIDSVLRAIRFSDTALLNRLFDGQQPQAAALLANVRSSISRFSLLHLTLSLPSLSLPVLTLLLSHGADPNVLDSSRSSPLHLACALRSVKAVKALMTAGADVEVVNVRGEVCWESCGTGDEARKMRTVIELMKGDRDGGTAKRAQEEKRKEEEEVRRVWRQPFYDHQRRLHQRRGREWVAADEQRRQLRERRAADLQGGDSARGEGRDGGVEDEDAASFAQFAVRVLRDEDVVAQMMQAASRAGEQQRPVRLSTGDDSPLASLRVPEAPAATRTAFTEEREGEAPRSAPQRPQTSRKKRWDA